jgi:hypothetical protein
MLYLLKQIGDLVGNPVSLFRDYGTEFKLITKFEYCKPNIGYGARLDPFILMTGKMEKVHTFSLYEFPSCCAFCVSTRAFTYDGFRNIGVNNLANQLRIFIAKECGYTALLCTDVLSNVAQRKTLQKNGWEDILQINNKRTGNDVAISIKRLT